MKDKQYALEFVTNSGKWQQVDVGSKEYIEKELDKRSKLFHDADRYRIRITKQRK